ncbi:MAG: sulfite exporter TauE/SafE family protein [Polyangiaceae bacterium]|nr:sulfite exporter TauE/SafE family protein [Polyangiaceae bacterium]
MMALGMLLAVAVGLLLGMLGGGGSILAVPILVYVMGLGAKQAVATSLIVVAITSAVGAVQHGRTGSVRWRVGFGFGAASMVGAYGGGRVAAYLPGTVILALFGVMLLATALAMLVRRERSEGSREPHRRSAWWIPVEGLVVGAVTGLVGAGGGFLVVPALIVLGGLGVKEAIGTSLLVITLKSAAGAVGYLGHVEMDWAVALGFSSAAVVGLVIGARLAERLPAQVLTRGFGGFVLLVGASLSAAELVRAGLVGWPAALVLGVAAVGLVLVVAARLTRRAAA